VLEPPTDSIATQTLVKKHQRSKRGGNTSIVLPRLAIENNQGAKAIVWIKEASLVRRFVQNGHPNWNPQERPAFASRPRNLVGSRDIVSGDSDESSQAGPDATYALFCEAPLSRYDTGWSLRW
jgi:hypothetical protein